MKRRLLGLLFVISLVLSFNTAVFANSGGCSTGGALAVEPYSLSIAVFTTSGGGEGGGLEYEPLQP